MAIDKDFQVKNGIVVNTNLIVATAGKVGINNTSPDASLTVTGTANISGLMTVNNISTTFINVGGVTINSSLYTGVANNATNLGGQNSTFYTNANNISSGVLSAARLSGAYGNITSVGNLTSLVTQNLTSGNTSLPNITITSNSTANVVTIGNSTIAVVMNADDGTFVVDGTTGRVGIGNTNPDAKLTVTGSANVSGDFVVGGNLIVRGTTTTVGTTTSNGDLIPIANGYNLGNTTNRWNVVGTNLNISNTATISNSATIASIVVVGNSTVNTVINSTSISTTTVLGQNASLTGSANVVTSLLVGNSTVNTVINATGISTTGLVSINGSLNVNGAINRSPTITLAGDLSGSVTLNGLANGTLTATIQPDSVALGTDTVGNYVATITAGNGLSGNAASEGSTPTINIAANNGLVANSTGLFAIPGTGVAINATGIHIGQNVATTATPTFNGISIAGATPSIQLHKFSNTYGGIVDYFNPNDSAFFRTSVDTANNFYVQDINVSSPQSLTINPSPNSTITGNVGINTSTPSAKLQINGDVVIGNSTLTTSAALIVRPGTTTKSIYLAPANSTYGSRIDFARASDNTSKWAVGAVSGNTLGHFDLENGSSLLSLTGGNSTILGNVGINTNAPTARLDVNGTGNFSGNLTTSTVLTTNTFFITGNTGGSISVGKYSTTFGGIIDIDTTSGSKWRVTPSGNNFSIQDATNGFNTPVILTPGSNSTVAGNVGIGITPTSAKLQIAGDVLTNGAIVVAGNSVVQVANVYFESSAANKITYSSNVISFVAGGNTVLTLGTNSTPRFDIFDDTNTVIFTVQKSGSTKVGINTASPSVPLDVAGNTNIIGLLTVNSGSTYGASLSGTTTSLLLARANTSYGGKIDFQNPSSNVSFACGDVVGTDFGIYDILSGNPALRVMVGNSTVTGNVGIGTNFSTPSAKLEVGGSFKSGSISSNSSITSTTGFGINVTTPSLSLEANTTDGFKIPSGNTNQRPTGANSIIRYNNETSKFEGYVGGVWSDLITAATPGMVVAVSNHQNNSISTISKVIPLDDTIPQITEGTEVMVLSHTPKSSTNLLKIDIVVNGDSINAPFCVALFQDSTANALSAIYKEEYDVDSGGMQIVSFRHFMTAGTTSSTTFRIRCGVTANTDTFTFNGAVGARKLGGVVRSSVTVTEIVG